MNKAYQFLWWAFLIAIPLQTRTIIFQWGWRFNEWQIISVYVTDIIFVVLLLSLLFRRERMDGSSRRFNLSESALATFCLVSLVSLFFAGNKGLGLFQFLKLIEFVALFIYVSRVAVRRFSFNGTALALVFGGCLQSLLAISQFVKQGDLGFRILGESLLNANMEGVAVFINSLDDKVMRAYGTTPHPNILAAYLVLSLTAAIWLFVGGTEGGKKRRLVLLVGFAVMLFALFATFSRTIIFFWLLAMLIGFTLAGLKNGAWAGIKRKIFALIAVFAVIAGLFSFMFWPDVSSRFKISGGEEAVQLRIFYNKEALKSGSVLNINWLGIGTGNFVPWLINFDPKLPQNLYQPVHNVYLLIYSENGILGLAAFLFFLVLLLKNSLRGALIDPWRSFALTVVAIFLASAFFDHFFWTLQEGRLIFWLALGLVAGYVGSRSRLAGPD